MNNKLKEWELASNEISSSRIYVAPNGKYGILIAIHGDGNRFTYLCNLENPNCNYIESRVACKAYWSNDSKYFIIDEGSGRSRWGNIYLAENCEQIEELRYRGLFYWINSEELIFVRENKDIKIDTGTEVCFTTDIIRYNVHTKQGIKLYEGNEEYYFSISNENANIFTINKNYTDSDEYEQINLSIE